MTFKSYLKAALTRATADAQRGQDDDNLEWINKLARRGVRANWRDLSARRFLSQYLWCVGSTQKDYLVRANYWNEQVRLFRQCDPSRIVADASTIWSEWSDKKCYLSPRTVNGVLSVAGQLDELGWVAFRSKYLPIPENPESESPKEWLATYWGLRELDEVGNAISWYLIRNLLGGPFFKPDVHLRAIAKHFFPETADHMGAMSEAARRLWPRVCTDHRFLPVHLAEVDYMLWWFRRNTRLPRIKLSAPVSCD